jgi:hypothetical protein
MAAQRGTPDPSQLAADVGGGVPVQDILSALRETLTAGTHQGLRYAAAVVLVGAAIGAIMIRGTAPHDEMARNEAADETD